MISLHNKGHNVLIMSVGEVPTEPCNPLSLMLLSRSSAVTQEFAQTREGHHLLDSTSISRGQFSPFQYMLCHGMFVNSTGSATVMLIGI